MGLAGKTILITGAAGGLGTALAIQCASDGANLVLLDKDRRALGLLSDRLAEKGFLPPGLYPMDLAGAGLEDFRQLATTIQAEFGGLDVLIHCALEFEGLQPLEQIEPQAWLKSMQVNVNAPWLLSCAVLPLLKQSKSGRLMFLLDDIGAVTGAYWGAYGVGKSALAGLVKQFDEALSNTSVLVQGINPGPMRTAFRAKVYHAENPADQPAPEVVARKIADLLSNEAAGQNQMLDFSA